MFFLASVVLVLALGGNYRKLFCKQNHKAGVSNIFQDKDSFADKGGAGIPHYTYCIEYFRVLHCLQLAIAVKLAAVVARLMLAGLALPTNFLV